MKSEKGHAFWAITKPNEMHCQNRSTRGTISGRKRGGSMCRWERRCGFPLKIELKSKQLTGCVAHLCKEGVTRISPGKKP